MALSVGNKGDEAAIKMAGKRNRGSAIKYSRLKMSEIAPQSKVKSQRNSILPS